MGRRSDWRETEDLMSMLTIAVAMAAVLLAIPAAAQPTFTRPVPPPPDAVAGRRVFMEPMEAGMQVDQLQPAIAGDLLFVEPLQSTEPTTGAPYSAEVVTESTQSLADGNRIVRRSTVQVARDSRGRERREHQAMMVGSMVAQRAVALVTITDPSGGTAVTIDHERQVATRMRMRRWGAPPMVTAMGGPAGGGVAVAPAAGAVAVVGGGAMSWTMTASDDVGVAVAGVPAPIGGEPQTVTLDPQTIEGVRVEGTRTTATIPAGAIGNELPIEIVNERWYSPELKIVVLSRRSDPRLGETVVRLTNLTRAEPAADLFEIPAGYRVEEPKAPPLPR
jgi:hypothetical protein